MIIQVVPNDREIVEGIIKSELFCYVPPRHKQKLLSKIWELSQSIFNHRVIRFKYTRKDGVKKEHQVKPVAIMFSEYYFYLIAFMADNLKNYPTVFRVDRMNNILELNKKFKVPYSFSDGEFRKRVQFMYSGKLQEVIFRYTGLSIEAVLDRLPTAVEKKLENDREYIVKAEVYGDGIDMWLRSQGDKVEILERRLKDE